MPHKSMVGLTLPGPRVLQAARAESFDHNGWDWLLPTRVEMLDGGRATVVDYSGRAKGRVRLNAYVPEKLDAQLREQTELFLSDCTRNRLARHRAELSSICKGYREDFERGWRDCGSLKAFMLAHGDAQALRPQAEQRLRGGVLGKTCPDYQWRLNGK